MKDNFDSLLHKAMVPDMEPSKELNEKVLNLCGEDTSKKNGKKKLTMITRVAAVALGIALVTPLAAYAAEQIKQLRNAYITDDSISVGNPEFVGIEDDGSEGEITSQSNGRVEGTANDKWLYKEERQLSNSVKNTFYGYKDYKTALEDTKLDDWFDKEYELSTDSGFNEEVIYTVVDLDDYHSYSISAAFKYNDGYFQVEQEKAEGNIADNATYTIQLSKAENSREYVNKAGIGYVMVDDIRTCELENGETLEEVVTIVIIKYDNYTGFIQFFNLSDDEIHEILDTVTVKNES
ncbi:MAG: hypothetical protein E7263_08505 [Lachnospiraceae bacterium]|nr:hypothetical protein [Lachnospiraceae bacterium]